MEKLLHLWSKLQKVFYIDDLTDGSTIEAIALQFCEVKNALNRDGYGTLFFMFFSKVYPDYVEALFPALTDEEQSAPDAEYLAVLKGMDTISKQLIPGQLPAGARVIRLTKTYRATYTKVEKSMSEDIQRGLITDRIELARNLRIESFSPTEKDQFLALSTQVGTQNQAHLEQPQNVMGKSTSASNFQSLRNRLAFAFHQPADEPSCSSSSNITNEDVSESSSTRPFHESTPASLASQTNHSISTFSARTLFHPEPTMELVETNLQRYKKAVSTANEHYQGYINSSDKKNYIHNRRIPPAVFSSWHHGPHGQSRANDFAVRFSTYATEEEAIRGLADYLRLDTTTFHCHSFATYLIDELNIVLEKLVTQELASLPQAETKKYYYDKRTAPTLLETILTNLLNAKSPDSDTDCALGQDRLNLNN